MNTKPQNCWVFEILQGPIDGPISRIASTKNFIHILLHQKFDRNGIDLTWCALMVCISIVFQVPNPMTCSIGEILRIPVKSYRIAGFIKTIFFHFSHHYPLIILPKKKVGCLRWHFGGGEPFAPKRFPMHGKNTVHNVGPDQPTNQILPPRKCSRRSTLKV